MSHPYVSEDTETNMKITKALHQWPILKQTQSISLMHVTNTVINPRRTCTRVTVVVLCVCVSVCVPVFSILPSRAFRRPTRGTSGYSAENAVKLKSRFL